MSVFSFNSLIIYGRSNIIDTIIDNHERSELFDDRSCLHGLKFVPSRSQWVVSETIVALIYLISILDFEVLSFINEVVQLFVKYAFEICVTRLRET